MFLTIFKKELLDQLINPKFLIVFFLCLVLIPPSFLMNYANYEENLKEYEFLKKNYREFLMNIRAIKLEIVGFRKPSLLSTFGVGLERTLSKEIVFGYHNTKTKGTKAEGETLSNIAGKVDFVYIVGYLLGLFAILYASTLIVSEKEAGTLKLILSNNTKRSTFIWGKFLAGYTILIIPLIISFLIGLVLLFFAGFPLFSGENLWRVIALLLMSLIFISTFFALGLFISTRTHKSSIALITSFLVWVFLTLVIPKISEPLANLIHPIQSDDAMRMNRTQVIYQLEKEKARKLAEPFRKYFIEQRDYRKYFEIEKPYQKEYRGKIKSAIQKIELKHQKEKEFNTNLSLLFSRLSPSSIYTNSALNLCNTGLPDRAEFFGDIRTHRITLENVFFKYAHWSLNINEEGKESYSTSSGYYGADLKKTPEFSSNFLILSETLSKSLIDIILLVIYNLILFASAYFSFIKYDIR
ncbi:MAG: ABC transporter permease [Candidatus Aminicenantia bacterium]